MDKTIIKNIFSMFSIQGINYLIPLIMVPYLVRTLGLDGFGVYSIILAITQYFVIIADYGFSLSASRQISLNIQNINIVSKIFFSVILSKLIIAFFVFLFITIFFIINKTFTQYYLLFINSMGIIIGTTFFPTWLFQGYEKMHWIAISNLVAKISGLILVLIFVNNTNDLWLAILIQSLVSMIAATIALTTAIVGKYVYILLPKIEDMIMQFKLGWSIFLSTFFVSMYTTSIPLILGYNSGAEAVGIYNAADKLKQALQGLIGPVSQAIYPRSNRLMHESRLKAIKFVVTISKILISLMLIGCLFVFYFSDQIIQLAFGVGHYDTAVVLKIIIWIPILVALANMLGIQIMLPMGLSKVFGKTYVLVGTLGLPLMFLGSYYGSYIGVSIISLLIELTITLIFSFIVFKKLREK